MQKPEQKPRHKGEFRELRENWSVFTFYERFEQVVALILTTVIAIIIVAALLRLLRNVFELLVLGALDPMDYAVFQGVFGMTLLIAMEFKHSILRVAVRRDSIIQVKTVVLIALLALARKFIILDVKTVSAASLAALSFAMIGLGAVYWLMRDRGLRFTEAEDAERSDADR